MSTTGATEESLARDLEETMNLSLVPDKKPLMSGSIEEAESSPDRDIPHYEFDADFQSKIAAAVIRDVKFNILTDGLILPEYLDDVGEAILVNIALEYFREYRRVPDGTIYAKLIKDRIASKRIREDLKDLVKETFVRLYKTDISDVDYIADEVAAFARQQAILNAFHESLGLIDSKNYDKVGTLITDAVGVGINKDFESYDYFGSIAMRSQERDDIINGKKVEYGITTGYKQIDARLYHRGYGRKELTLYMGAPKIGKSMALAEAARVASLSGFNVLIVTLEVSVKIYSDRLDANITDTAMRELAQRGPDVEKRLKSLLSRAGTLKIHEFPSGSFSPSMLRRLLARYRQARNPIQFDMVVIDYADLMIPNIRTRDPIENSKQIYSDLRAIAQEDNIAMLTATQTNREGAKSEVAKSEHVAEDFNRIRIADLVISINRTEEEKRSNKARLYFAASRNQEGDITINITQDLPKMKFIRSILSVE